MGLIFTLFSLVLFLSKSIYYIAIKHDLGKIFSIDHASYFIYIFIFLYTVYNINLFAKIIQIGIIAVEGIYDLSIDPQNPTFGLILIISALILLYVYGIFARHKIVKSIMLTIIIYCIFAFISLGNDSNQFLRALSWTAFIITFLFFLWIVSKDSLDKLRELEEKERSELLQAANEAASIAREAIGMQDNKGTSHG